MVSNRGQKELISSHLLSLRQFPFIYFMVKSWELTDDEKLM